MDNKAASPALHGLMAEFETPEQLIAAAAKTRQAGYVRIEAYSPFPVEGLDEAIGFSRSRLPLLVLLGGVVGGVGGFLLQAFACVYHYPHNTGGKPLFSWPAFIPVTFELTVLGAAFAAVLGMLALNGLPQPYHPVFNVPRFQLATRDRFFVMIESRDPKFDAGKTKKFLESLNPRGVYDVEP